MILVTGASGLLGNDLLRRLIADGRTARGIDLRPASESLVNRNIETGDLLNPQTCHRACRDVDLIVHCAARQHQDAPRWGRRDYFAANVEMTRNLVVAASAAGVRHFVFVSSDMVYGLPPGRALRETDTPRPIGPYGESKFAAEQVCMKARDRGTTTTVLRPRLIIGPGRLGVLKRLFDAVRAGRPIPMIGSGTNRYQMVAVADVVEACVCALDRRPVGVFNLGSASPPPVLDLLCELCRRAETRSRPYACPAWAVTASLWALDKIRIAPLVPEQFRIAPLDYVLDINAARKALNWNPRFTDIEMLWQAYLVYTGAVTVPRSAAQETVSSSDLQPARPRAEAASSDRRQQKPDRAGAEAGVQGPR